MPTPGTAFQDLSTLVERQKNAALAGELKPLKARRDLLARLKELLQRHESMLCQAVHEDFRKSAFDVYSSELSLVYHELDLALRKLKKWSRPRRVPSNALGFPSKACQILEPYGHCLIIGAWNYPLQLTLSPLIAAIAAGNACLVKPSELAPRTSNALARLINENFDPGHLAAVEGDAKVAEEVLGHHFDKIFFTGSTAVGRIVAQAAAKHLTPVTLELGGKSPCLVLKDSDLKVAARRIVWGKFLNAGQTCIAPDYLMADSEIHDELVENLKAEIRLQLGEDPFLSASFPRIINQRHVKRLKGLIENRQVALGGEVREDENYISPTLLTDVRPSDPVMQDEIFGPLLPILKMENLEKGLEEIRSRPKPLALYVFTKSRGLADKVLHSLSFGGGCVNDTLLHITNSHLPFGGVGESGMGNYHGEHGFKTFSHAKSVIKKGFWPDPALRYPPHAGWTLRLLRFLFG